MRYGLVLALVALLALLTVAQVSAAVLFSDGFESYTAGNSPLDKNTAGPNAAPNGSGNPWFGPTPPNARVVGTTGSVTPHSGNNMITASAPSDFDQNWVNLAYRFNGGSAFTGGIYLDWWFYDPSGAGGTNVRDYAALGYYTAAPAGTDYPGTGSLNGGSVWQRISLGCSNTAAGYDANKYQIRIVGATDGLGGGQWFNTSTSRSVGWHEMKIQVGAALGNGTNDLAFYIDNMASPIFTHNSMTSVGYNVLEFNTGFGSSPAFYDDASFGRVPEPGSLIALAVGLVSLVGLRRRRS